MESICPNCEKELCFFEVQAQECHSCKWSSKANAAKEFMEEWNTLRVENEALPQVKISTHPIAAEILAERKRQDEKWGEQNHSPVEWLAILGEEVGEATQNIVNAHFSKQHYQSIHYRIQQLKDCRIELIQVAAVVISMIESLDRNELQEE